MAGRAYLDKERAYLDEGRAYLDEEYDLSGDLLPCEFCKNLFPLDIFIEHETGCKPELFYGSGEPNRVPEVVTPQPQKDRITQDKKVLHPKVSESSSIKIEQLVRNDVFDIQLKNGGGYVMKKMADLEIDNSVETAEPSSYIHYKTSIDEQDESESDDDELSPEVQSQQSLSNISSSGGTSGIQNLGADTDDTLELSDDNNEENETIEKFLVKASLELNKIRRSLAGARPKFTSYSDQETAAYHHRHIKSLQSQNCY